MSKSFIQYLSGPTDDPNVTALAAEKSERFVPANLATVLTLTKQPIADHTAVYKNGSRMDPVTGYAVVGNTITLSVPATGSEVYLVDFFFRATN